VHFCDDLHALIQPEADPSHPELPARALLLTSLRTSAPVILLNVSLGDRARMMRRRCGCPLEGHGWDRHLDGIRSFEKLTAGGMTFLDVDVAAVLETDLPARFGGGPADYQLLETERADGGPALVLRVHPRVGPLDEGAVRRAPDAIGAGARARSASWPPTERRGLSRGSSAAAAVSEGKPCPAIPAPAADQAAVRLPDDAAAPAPAWGRAVATSMSGGQAVRQQAEGADQRSRRGGSPVSQRRPCRINACGAAAAR
jgi:hypothetical protein